MTQSYSFVLDNSRASPTTYSIPTRSGSRSWPEMENSRLTHTSTRILDVARLFDLPDGYPDRRHDHAIRMTVWEIEGRCQVEDVAEPSEHAAEHRELSAYRPCRRSRAERAGSNLRALAPAPRRKMGPNRHAAGTLTP
jgi:hypothetical protein